MAIPNSNRNWRYFRIAGVICLFVIFGAGIFVYKFINARYDEQVSSYMQPVSGMRTAEKKADSAQPVCKEYRPGGDSFAKVWDKFYKGDHEPELDDPLIEAGGKMVPYICEAIVHRDMMLRRYAISAVGYIKDKQALSSLEAILEDKTEEDYFRGDALHAIYLIDEAQGAIFAARYKKDNSYLERISSAIEKKEAWLKAPTEE